MKVKTKSGFVIDIDEGKVAEWTFVDNLVDMESADQSRRIVATRNAIKYLLGEDGTEKLAEHVKNDKGIRSFGLMLEEFKEIMALLGEKQKKSSSSPE